MPAVTQIQQEFNKPCDSDKLAFLTGIVEESTGHTEVSELKAEINQVNKKHCPHCQSNSIVANSRNKGV